MMQGTLKPKILLAVDLDDTLFKFNKPGIEWIGSEAFWYSLFEYAHHIADSKGVELVFCIVTHKDEFDDLCETAARKFKIWLEYFCPSFIINKDNKDWCLCNNLGKLEYICISDQAYNTTLDSIPLGVPSPFIVADGAKWGSISALADYHQIALENCILIDDNPDVIENAKKHAIQTIPLTIFYQADEKLFDDHNLVNETLAEVQNKLTHQIYAACSRVNKPNHPSSEVESMQVLTFLYDGLRLTLNPALKCDDPFKSNQKESITKLL